MWSFVSGFFTPHVFKVQPCPTTNWYCIPPCGYGYSTLLKICSMDVQVVSHVWIFDLLDCFSFLFALLSRFPNPSFLSLLLYLVLFFLANFLLYLFPVIQHLDFVSCIIFFQLSEKIIHLKCFLMPAIAVSTKQYYSVCLALAFLRCPVILSAVQKC